MFQHRGERGWTRRDERDQQSIALYNPAREGGDKQEGHRGGAGMRKSAVSLRSGAGMPVHMAEGGEGERHDMKGKDLMSHHYIVSGQRHNTYEFRKCGIFLQ